MSVLKRAFCAAVAAIGMSVPLAAHAETSLCDQLAAQTRTVPSNGWNGGDLWDAQENALKPALAIEKPSNKPSPFETQLARLSWVKKAVDAGDYGVDSVERLPGTDVYMISTVQGTLHCQNSIFLEAKPGAEPKSLAAAPMEWGEGDMCWTVSGDFGQVFGHPAFIAHGTLNDHTNDEDIRIVPWTGAGWGKMCKVALRFRRTFTLTHTYCGDRDVCRAGEAVAVDAATAYDKVRAQTDTVSNFHFGPPPTKDALDATGRATKAPGSNLATPEFPTFGATAPIGDPLRYSYNGFTYFPLILNGKSYVGALGYDGVGWRESGRTLFAIYSEDKGALTPLAGFAVDLSNGGLISAAAENGPQK
jgi:hypothetical protein